MIEQLNALLVSTQNLPISEGQSTGTCAFCGQTGSNFLPFIPKETFTNAEFLHGYNFACPACAFIYNDQKTSKFYRNHNWNVTQRGFRVLERAEVLDTILSLDPDEFPFAIYTTNSYQKQGFLRLLGHGLNYSHGFMTIAWDTILFQISAALIRQIMQFAGWCQTRGMYQSEMLSGNVRNLILKQIEAETGQSLAFLRVLRKWSKQIPFQWVISFFPKEFQSIIEKHQINISAGYGLL